MRWLEGWFGVASGALGFVWVVIAAVFIPTPSQPYTRTCGSMNGGPTHCYGPDGAPVSPNGPGVNVGLLILFAVILLLFIGVLLGTLLDLRGARTAGRIILLISVTLLLLFAPFAERSALGPSAYVYLLTLLAFAAGVLACVRRDLTP